MSDSIYNSRYQKPQVNSQVDPSQSNYYQPNSQNNGIEGQSYNEMMQGNDPVPIPGNGSQSPSSDLTAGQQILVDKLHSTEEAMASKLQELENKYDSIRNSGASPDQVLAEINELNSLVNELEGKESLYEQLQYSLNQAGIDTVGFDMEKQIDKFEEALKGLESKAKDLKQEEIKQKKEDEAEAKKEALEAEKKEAAEQAAEAAEVEAEKKEAAAEFSEKMSELSKSLDGRNGWVFAAKVGPDGKHIYSHYEGPTQKVQSLMKQMTSAASNDDWSKVISEIKGLSTKDGTANQTICLLFNVLQNDPDVFESLPKDLLITMTEKLGVDFEKNRGKDAVLGALGGHVGGILAGDPLLGTLLGTVVGALSGDIGIYSLPPESYPPKDNRRRKDMVNTRTTPKGVAEELLVMISKIQAAEAKAAADTAKDAAKG